MNGYVIAKCVGCGDMRKIFPGEVQEGEQPMCYCGMPMIAHKAVATTRRQPRIHMAGKSMQYAGMSALCWKWPKRIKDPEDYTLHWDQVTCKKVFVFEAVAGACRRCWSWRESMNNYR